MKWVCANCGSPRVEQKFWVDINTNEIMSPASDGESDDNWCDECSSHPEIVTEKEFFDRQKDKEKDEEE